MLYFKSDIETVRECGMRTPTSFNLICWAEVLGGEIVFVVDRASTSEITIKQAKNDNKQDDEKF